jgi:acyl-CoA dehydrogenase
MLADTAVDIHLTKLLAFETAWKVDQGMDVRDEANMIKVLGTEMAYRAMDRYIQCFGGIGLTKTLPLERWLRELRVLRITDGASEVLRWVLARSLLKGWRP